MPSNSCFEYLPRDVLQHIAYLCVSGSPFDSLGVIPRLLQTCSTINRTLNLDAAADLYAHIFATKFDMLTSSQRHSQQLTDSAFSRELVNRCLLLRRAQHMDFSPGGLLQAMWTALWMLLENEHLNAQQLSAVNFTGFILGLAHNVLGYDPSSTWAVDLGADSYQLKQITVWILCLSLSRRVIVDMQKQDRDDLYNIIFPFIFLSNKTSTALPPDSSLMSALGCSSDLERQTNGPKDALSDRKDVVMAYLKYSLPLVPHPSTAAINLACVIHEATQMQVPHHLPESRAIANANQRSGPTLEDYRVFTSYQCLLFADYIQTDPRKPAAAPISRNPRTVMARVRCDIQFQDVLQPCRDHADTFHYIPGTLSALWEGVYRTLNVPISNVTETAMTLSPFMKPMQCKITEYICRMDAEGESPFPLDTSEVVGYEPSSDISAFDISGTELHTGGRIYQKYQLPSGHHDDTTESNPLYDVILLGETLEEHSHAWGGFKFSGRVHRDGSIALKREADASSHQSEGVWIFVGRLHFPDMILGRWRITAAPDSAAFDHGVFSMGRARH